VGEIATVHARAVPVGGRSKIITISTPRSCICSQVASAAEIRKIKRFVFFAHPVAVRGQIKSRFDLSNQPMWRMHFDTHGSGFCSRTCAGLAGAQPKFSRSYSQPGCLAMIGSGRVWQRESRRGLPAHTTPVSLRCSRRVWRGGARVRRRRIQTTRSRAPYRPQRRPSAPSAAGPRA
jgi:hypothetical protein